MNDKPERYYMLTFGHLPDLPPVKKRELANVIVAVKRKSTGKTYTFSAVYLNAYPLVYEDCQCKNEDDHIGGCSTTGWFTSESNPEWPDGCFFPLLGIDDELVAWAMIPQYGEKAK